MKYNSLYMTALAIVMAVAFSSCKKNIIWVPTDPPDPNIIMTTSKSGVVSIKMQGTGSAEIDWGDGEKSGVVFYHNIPVEFTHNYSGSSPKTIKITYGGSVTHFNCSSLELTNLDVSNAPTLKELRCSVNQLTSLDLSKNSALTVLSCSINQLQGILDVSKNTALIELWCNWNRLTGLNASGLDALIYVECSSNYMDTAALNALFGTLNSAPGMKTIFIGNNGPNYNGIGTNGCDRNIATGKGWTVGV